MVILYSPVIVSRHEILIRVHMLNQQFLLVKLSFYRLQPFK